ncbi:protein phosphatase Slingshot homolog 2 [Trichomycterus rosablanca]|uniref:protein phosphatase Slingshot homolog 2 n=1 Tax=Trichomycterus rosablanca TaxID=2290929 RepID=UPI002F35ABBC
MTPGESRAVPENSAAAAVCSRCAAKIMPYFTDNAVASHNQINQLINENFLTVKGAALFLPCGNGSPNSSLPRITQRRNKHTGDLQQHLQTMFTLLRPEDTIRLAVRLESAYPQCTRYMVVVSTNGRQDTEESVVLGMDFTSSDCNQCTVGLVLPLWSDTLIHLDGDGGFSVSTANRNHIFKPVSVQAMWSSLQSLHKACEVARCHNYYPGSLFLTWVSYYQTRITSEQHCVNEWNAMRDVQSHRSDSPVLFTDIPTERERTERLIKTRLREIMMQKDLENVTSKEIRSELEMQMVCNLREFKEFIDNEMIVILGQMDSPTEIFDHVFLGSEWNASNLDELQSSGVRYILNVTREIDNFFPGLFEYHNIRVYDEEATNLLEYWNDTYKFISKAKKAGVKCLVHCKMGVSRSASTVIAYAMKEYGWDLDRAYEHVKERRTVTKPNPSFMKQLEEYQGILLASKQRHNKLWRSHSDSDLSEQQEPACKSPRTLGRSDPHNQQHKPNIARSIHNVLQNINGSQSGTDDSHIELSIRFSTEENLNSESPTTAVVPEQTLPESSSLKISVPVPITHSQSSPPPASSTTEPSPPAPKPKTDSKTDIELGQGVPAPSDSWKNSQSFRNCNLALHLNTVNHLNETDNTLASPGSPMSISPSEAPQEPESLSRRGSESCCSGETIQNTANANWSSLSTDSIDFFSAREKFQGLSQDGQTNSVCEEVTPCSSPSRSTSLCLEEPSVPAVEETLSHPESSCVPVASPTAEPNTDFPDNTMSVHHVVSDLDKPQDQTTLEDRQVKKENEVNEDETSLSSHFNSHEGLDDGQKQEISLPHSALQPPCTESAEEQESSSPPGGAVTSSCTDTSKHEVRGDDARPLDDDDSGIIPDPSLDTATVNPSLDPSSSSSSLLWLESDTEEAAPRPRDLHKIQETLRELQAFLYEAGGTEARLNHSRQLQNTHSSAESQPRAPAVWQRAMEMEARIRQAGLTPPSLMKRSASLAKLDQLELSTHDLNDWDFRSELPSPSSSSSSSSRSHSYSHALSDSHDEAHKKQRVLPQIPSDTDRTETSSTTPQNGHGGGTGPPTHDSDPPVVSVCTREQQHAKTHPVRRQRKSADKKKTVTVLYNTM